MIFKYAVKQLKRRPFMTILILFQFAVITLLISMILTKISSYFVTSNLIKKICEGDSYYIQYDISYSIEKDDRAGELSNAFDAEFQPYLDKLNNQEITQEELEKKYKELDKKYDKIRKEENLDECSAPPDISKLPYVGKIYAYYDSTLTYTPDDLITLLSTDYTNDLNFKMQSGNWLSDAEQTDDYLNLVAFSSSNYNIGDVIDVSMGDVDGAIKGKIVGLADYSYYKEICEHGSFETDNYLSLDNMLQFNSATIFAEYSPDFFEEKAKKYFFFLEPFSQSVKLKDNITQEEKDEFFSAATSNKYECVDLKKAYQNTYIRDKKNFQNDIIFLITASLIAIISLIGMTALSVSKEIKTYSIYCLNGMTRKQCIGINAVVISLLVIISTLIAFIVKFSYSYWCYIKRYIDLAAFYSKEHAKAVVKFSNYFSIGTSEAVAVIILLCIAFISAMIIPYFTLKRLDIIQNIKENR